MKGDVSHTRRGGGGTEGHPTYMHTIITKLVGVMSGPPRRVMVGTEVYQLYTNKILL